MLPYFSHTNYRLSFGTPFITSRHAALGVSVSQDLIGSAGAQNKYVRVRAILLTRHNRGRLQNLPSYDRNAQETSSFDLPPSFFDFVLEGKPSWSVFANSKQFVDHKLDMLKELQKHITTRLPQSIAPVERTLYWDQLFTYPAFYEDGELLEGTFLTTRNRLGLGVLNVTGDEFTDPHTLTPLTSEVVILFPRVVQWQIGGKLTVPAPIMAMTTMRKKGSKLFITLDPVYPSAVISTKSFQVRVQGSGHGFLSAINEITSKYYKLSPDSRFLFTAQNSGIVSGTKSKEGQFRAYYHLVVNSHASHTSIASLITPPGIPKEVVHSTLLDHYCHTEEETEQFMLAWGRYKQEVDFTQVNCVSVKEKISAGFGMLMFDFVHNEEEANSSSFELPPFKESSFQTDETEEWKLL